MATRMQQKDDPVEHAGKEIDNGVEKVGQQIENIGKEIDKGVEKTWEQIEKTGEKVQGAAKGAKLIIAVGRNCNSQSAV